MNAVRLILSLAAASFSTFPSWVHAGLACGGYSMWRRRKAKAVFAVALVSIVVAGSDPALADPVTIPLPDVAFGNLGGSGTDALGGLSADLIESGTGGTQIAMSFVTGSTGPWQLSGLRLGIGSPTNNPVPFALITPDDAGNPLMSTVAALFYIPGELNSVTTTGFYDFTLAFGAELQPSTTYWLVVGDDSPTSSSFGWYDNAAGVFPTAQNDSGWTFDMTKVSLDGGSTWGDYSDGNAAAFSITVAPVPEPSSYAMALAGLACGGWHLRRRRRAAREVGQRARAWPARPLAATLSMPSLLPGRIASPRRFAAGN